MNTFTLLQRMAEAVCKELHDTYKVLIPASGIMLTRVVVFTEALAMFNTLFARLDELTTETQLMQALREGLKTLVSTPNRKGTKYLSAASDVTRICTRVMTENRQEKENAGVGPALGD